MVMDTVTTTDMVTDTDTVMAMVTVIILKMIKNQPASGTELLVFLSGNSLQ